MNHLYANTSEYQMLELVKKYLSTYAVVKCAKNVYYIISYI